MSFFSALKSRVDQVDSLLCVGLDPHPQDLPEYTAEAAKRFCFQLIESTIDLAAAYKPNAAFFEALGTVGMEALKEVISAIPGQVPVILDAKRGDIASTAEAYAKAAFNFLGADAITINPYLGRDAVQPFLSDPEKGVFLLCKTSNPGASDLQDLAVVPQDRCLPPVASTDSVLPVFLQVASIANDWNENDNLGLVVGATHPESLARVRALAPQLWILAPGVGAQGGNLENALQSGLREDGMGMLISVSRGLSRSENPHKAAENLRDAINVERIKVKKGRNQVQRPAKNHLRMDLVPSLGELADGLLDAGCFRFGSFTLKSGVESPIYIDLRRLVGYPGLLTKVAQAYIPLLRGLTFDVMAALPYAALPITSAISLLSGWSMIYPRKEVKSYGTKAQIEGVYKPGDTVVVVDDLVTTGRSKFEGIERLAAGGLVVKDIVVLIDRSHDRGAALTRQGYQLHTVLQLDQLLDYYLNTGKVSVELVQAVRVFLTKQQDGPQSR